MKKILVAPLDWGLGHATRCIPLIKALLAADCSVVLAGEGKTATLLQAEFPQLPFLFLPGYGVTYAKTKLALTAKIIAQIPKIKAAIQNEHLWLQNAVTAYHIDAVISDNRYGLYHSTIPCIFITHQLLIKTGFGTPADQWLQKKVYHYINQFTECWVPDSEEGFTLAGALSHPKQSLKIPVRYIHFLSRFKTPAETKLTHFLLILLSGPEPQRTALEELLLQQLTSVKEPVFFVRGLPGNLSLPSVPPHVTIVNHLATQALQNAMECATYIISRCGYSTVMDIATVKKKALMIPTPGQTEQEYLAKYLMENKIALCLPQSKFKLKAALELANSFPYKIEMEPENNALQTAVASLMDRLNN